MTLELFSSTTSQYENPGPGAYNSDPYKVMGGPLSLKYSIKPKLKSTFNAQGTLTSKVDFMPLRNTVDRLPKNCKIAPRYPEVPPKITVGPSYVPEPDFKRKQAYTIKSRYPDQDSTITPGPGAYDPRECSRTNPPPMGSRPPIVLSDPSCSPGPAAYNVSRDINQNSLKYSIRPITAPAVEEREDPGYAYNNPRDIGEDQPKFTISRQAKRSYVNDIPGPGTYQPRSLQGRSQIGRSIHPKVYPPVEDVVDVPYENTRRFPDQRPTTIHKRCGREYWVVDSSIPGPNWVPESSIQGRQHFLGKREAPQQKEPSQTPGPCTYNITTSPTRHSEPAFSFKGPSIRDDWLPKSKEMPGPGYYDIKSGNNLPKWTIGERSLSQARERARERARAQTAAYNGRGNQMGQRGAKTSLH
ncbi:hypothetical protein TRFO_40677 [Tritrichomonas foetus]|uniref:Uncharacterized protein n=1 Tax=Tritrichomonas foetus TaxID=1144522 RepID=A0A1J4J5U4_9EUKA|nr:hypothetical protein TRFO_40677 [Tritrichomonas foetus]|eukprot:OHS93019.1 hypothetical protein TRFO_40677 [Tritrichomonas foetus]